MLLQGTVELLCGLPGAGFDSSTSILADSKPSGLSDYSTTSPGITTLEETTNRGQKPTNPYQEGESRFPKTKANDLYRMRQRCREE
ncbi:hypothetical protein AVEN_255844-1 [Araneus ventricosus]|uniref:Uncharacterized protein n=1 Tax=Araneus ventricosus TaxID=182803 RepID=A0A4Y2EMB5_ARAVE|nr:hypothetical protein AVEN_255844-1 [Araneus ventricosus]